MSDKIDQQNPDREARRKFLKKAAAGAALTPPAVTMVLSAGSRKAFAGNIIPSNGTMSTITTVV